MMEASCHGALDRSQAAERDHREHDEPVVVADGRIDAQAYGRMAAPAVPVSAVPTANAIMHSIRVDPDELRCFAVLGGRIMSPISVRSRKTQRPQASSADIRKA